MKIILIIPILLSFNLWAQSNKNFTAGNGIKADELNSATLSIGSIQQSLLTLAQFQSLNGNCWRLMDGGSLANTDLGTLTGRSILPNMVANNAFLRQASTEADVTTYQADAFQGHRHAITRPGGTTNGSQRRYVVETGYANGPSTTATADGSDTYVRAAAPLSLTNFGTVRYDAETRPKNYSFNFFIKVNKLCTF